MKTHRDYIDDACKYLDEERGYKIVYDYDKASPTQLQTINLALVMAITDLIKTLEDKSS